MRKKFVPLMVLAAGLFFVGCGQIFDHCNPIDPGDGGCGGHCGGGKGGNGGGSGGDTLIVDTLVYNPGDTIWIDPADTLANGRRH